ncbi:VOC family protein [Sphingomonas sp. LB-2]|uniref:VOC family protein n=1 Tax=Sphingomonas caeni TaxID=2984949 RepID=UPI0022317601|nr:VOC family protein [Sphingomonas caeni]MCW3848153.1 VOC family protein [Sphingomonas caeni]
MTKKLFISLPVSNVAASVAFYEAIGMTRDPAFPSGENGAAMNWSDSVCFMLSSHAAFGALTSKPIADTHATVANLFALSMDSREAVDAVFKAALAAGGREVHGVEDEGFMYSVGFEDPDGYGFGPFHMDMEAVPAEA